MWTGYEPALLYYGFVICQEWWCRGYEDNMEHRFIHELINKYNINVFKNKDCEKIKYPKWIFKRKLINSHRSNLLRKDNKYYSEFKWKVKDNLPYYWEK
jgi:hypothetical protein